MQLGSKLNCAHCGRKVDLVEGHFRMPRFGGRWYEIGEEISRYRCGACEGVNRVTMSWIAVVLLVVLVAAFSVGWWHFGYNKQMLITGAVIALLLIMMNGWTLSKA